MKELPILNSPPVFIEIGQGSLNALRENRGITLPIERDANGKLTAASRAKTAAALEKFFARKSWQQRIRAVCGIGARGVVLRKITLPATSENDFDRVLQLQIEGEFPLAPEDLAWGWRDVSGVQTGKREIFVAAVRKEIIDDYAALLTAAGANPEFTLAAMARNALHPKPAGSHAILDAWHTDAELACFENGMLSSVRTFSTVPAAALEMAEKHAGARTIMVSGLAAVNGHCRLDVSGGEGCSAATLGLRTMVAENTPLFLLRTRFKPAKRNFAVSWTEHRDWLSRAAVLLGILLVLPYAEPLLLKPFLAKKLAAFKAEKERFASVVEPELRFLQSYKQNQPPYLDAFYIFAKAAPPGFKLDSISLDQHGAISLRAVVQNAQQVMDFRARLIDSGFFDNIVVEEQSPTPDRQRVNIRMTAQWKPAGSRPLIKVPPAENKSGNSNNSDSQQP